MAEHLALVVIALQAVLLLAFAATPTDPPPRITLFELLWASARKPTFYPLVALILAGPPLTILALRKAGRHRWWLAISWVGFAALLIACFGQRVAVMLRVLWWQVS